MNPATATRDDSPARIGNRRKVRVPGRLTWRDASGTLRFVSVMTRDVSDVDAFGVVSEQRVDDRRRELNRYSPRFRQYRASPSQSKWKGAALS